MHVPHCFLYTWICSKNQLRSVFHYFTPSLAGEQVYMEDNLVFIIILWIGSYMRGTKSTLRVQIQAYFVWGRT